jgi:hypothetical protein
MSDSKATLRDYLQGGRETLLWKLDGLSEHDVRRPLVRSGTNLLGLVKHTAYSELVYFGDAFGRRSDEPSPFVDGDLDADMWATREESRADIVELYRRAWAHSDATIEALDLDAVGHVPHWPPPRNEVTLHHVLVHVIVDTQRHAGHADILRELIDGRVGLLPASDNMPSPDPEYWRRRVERLQQIADEVREG